MKKNSIVLILVGLMLVSILTNLSIVVYIIINKIDIEKFLISTMVTLFSTIVSAWMGLNIYNILDKEKVERACLRADDAIDKANTLNSISRNVTKAEIINVLSKNLLYYTSSSFLLFEFSEKDVSSILDNKILLKILEIENMFEAAGSAQRSKNFEERCRLASYGEQLCEEFNKLLEQTTKSNFWEGYYYLRKADFIYYQNYRIYNSDNAKNLDSAINLYKRALKDITNAILKNTKEFNLDNLINNRKISQESKAELLKFTAYIFNVVAESYNVRCQYPYKLCDNCLTDYQKKQAAENFLYMYKICIYLCEGKISRLAHPCATYFRNFGTSLERISIKDIDSSSDLDCTQLYLNALEINPLDTLSHLNYAKIELKKVTDSLISKSEKLEIAPALGQNLLSKLKCDILEHIEFLRHSDSQKIIGAKFMAWYYALIAFTGNQVNIIKFKKAIEILRVWKIDPFIADDIDRDNCENRCITFLENCYKEFGK